VRELTALYHQRWEIADRLPGADVLRLGGQVLRARTLASVEQEIYGLLVTYQALRTAMADAAGNVPGAGGAVR
jgi:hypothetical protein